MRYKRFEIMKSTKGFTLIELLITVGVISMLALIAVPNFLLAQERAHIAKCASNLKSLAYALYAYRIDYNHYPLADGTAGSEPSPGETSVGNGPAANGSWDGVPWVLRNLGYIQNRETFYCPTLIKRYPHRRENLRYAYNSAAADTWGYWGGAENIDIRSDDIWLVRCLWVPYEYSFHPSQKVEYPYGEQRDMENVLFSNSRVELRNGQAEFYQRYNLD